jgi:putative hydrolase of the HAD superfamily
MVDVEVFSCEVGLRKPDPRIYRLAAERLGVDPERCLYVGDGAYGELSGAAAVGMHAVLIRDPADAEIEALRPEAEEWDGPSIEDLREVTELVLGPGD